MKAVTCILHYGNVERTRRLHQILADADDPENVLVFDSASPETYPGAWYRSEKNLYWAGALALTLDKLEAEGYSHVWFCNNDILPLSPAPWLERLTARCRKLEHNGKVGIISPSFSANPYHGQMLNKPGSSCLPAPYVDGIAPFLSLECLREIGGVDFGQNPYGYGVDIWLSLRAKRAGWGVFVDHNINFRHSYHATARSSPGFMDAAAKAEERYMRERLGINWREELQALREHHERAV